MKRRLFAYLFSWRLGLLLTAGLLLFFAWLLVYVPSIGETNRIDALDAEFKAHGFSSFFIETVPMFENHFPLKHMGLKKKAIRGITFDSGARIPPRFQSEPPYIPGLQEIAFVDCNPTDELFQWACRFRGLDGIALWGTEDTSPEGFAAMKNGDSGLFNLRISKSPDIRQTLSKLARSNADCRLALRMRDLELDEDCFQSLVECRFLVALVLDDCTGLSPQCFRLLHGTNSIDILMIHNSGLNDEMLREIAQIPKLHSFIERDHPEITPEAKEEFKEALRPRVEAVRQQMAEVQP